MNQMRVTIGCDPEVFVTRNGVIISAIDLIGGSKENPLPVLDGTLQEDNVLAEIGITPANNVDEFTHHINHVLAQLRERLGGGYDLAIKASHQFDFAELEKDPRAMEFGCEPDFDVWTGQMNEKPMAYDIRSAGGHVHLGFDTSVISRENVIKCCDVLIGLPSVLLDDDKMRRMMYGRAGCFRPKSYGVEYRTPSNFWLRSDVLMRWIYGQAQQAVVMSLHTDKVAQVQNYCDAIRNAIDYSDEALAAELLAIFGVEIPTNVHA